MDIITSRFVYILKFFTFFCGYPIYGIFSLISIFIPILKKYRAEFIENNTSKSYLVIDFVGTAGFSMIVLLIESLSESLSIPNYLKYNWQNFASLIISWLALGYIGLYGLYEFKFKKQ